MKVGSVVCGRREGRKKPRLGAVHKETRGILIAAHSVGYAFQVAEIGKIDSDVICIGKNRRVKLFKGSNERVDGAEEKERAETAALLDSPFDVNPGLVFLTNYRVNTDIVKKTLDEGKKPRRKILLF